MDRLLVIEPLDLIFRLDLGKKSQASVQLKNVMHTMPIAFNVQPSAPKRYTIKPARGLIAPLDEAVVTITLHPQSEVPLSVSSSDDKFLVQSVVVPGGSENDAVLPDWFTANKKQVYSDHGIRVFFIGGCILRKFVAAGCMEDTREVLEFDESLVDSKDEHGSTALHVAVARKRPDLVQLLLEFKASVDVKNKMGQTALQEAAMHGQAVIAELLLAKSADVNTRTLLGQTALQMAISAGHAEIAKLLIERGADVNESAKNGTTLLHMAVDEARYECLDILLQMGANANARLKADGSTPLHRAVERGDDKAMEILLRHGACRELKNRSGKSPGDLAQAKGQQGHALYLALVLGENFRRESRRGNGLDVQKCLRKGALPAGGDEYGWTALHMTAFKGHMGVARMLVEAGADLECKDDDGYTPLHCASEAGNKDIVKLLLKHGAPADVGTCKGITALDLAATFKYSRIVSLLLEWGGCSRKGSKAAKSQEYVKVFAEQS